MCEIWTEYGWNMIGISMECGWYMDGMFSIQSIPFLPPKNKAEVECKDINFSSKIDADLMLKIRGIYIGKIKLKIMSEKNNLEWII